MGYFVFRNWDDDPIDDLEWGAENEAPTTKLPVAEPVWVDVDDETLRFVRSVDDSALCHGDFVSVFYLDKHSMAGDDDRCCLHTKSSNGGRYPGRWIRFS